MTGWKDDATNAILAAVVPHGELHERVAAAKEIRAILDQHAQHLEGRSLGLAALETWLNVEQGADLIEAVSASIQRARESVEKQFAAREGPLLQCTSCRHTESPSGAMARQFNQGRCMHCGGWFKVVRA